MVTSNNVETNSYIDGLKEYISLASDQIIEELARRIDSYLYEPEGESPFVEKSVIVEGKQGELIDLKSVPSINGATEYRITRFSSSGATTGQARRPFEEIIIRFPEGENKGKIGHGLDKMDGVKTERIISILSQLDDSDFPSLTEGLIKRRNKYVSR